MPLFALTDELIFPQAHLAGADGLLAIGGDLKLERLLEAYSHGIFPWYSEPPVLWWSPDPRLVLFPPELIISNSMKKCMRKNTFHFTMNRAFEKVIHACKTVYRPSQQGTWITDELEAAFVNLHYNGYAQSGEAWLENELVGGLYGLRLGNIFFAESMFSLETNASKFVLIHFVKQLQNEGVILIDCQVYSSHLLSLGAREISRSDFIKFLELHC
ncbi:MAG: leucyl/phenylalanyl-tRNA--protein transferase [Chitinophagaceae bacterium]|nr:leucyl/phenylalanyl-tRNA--protein transferase [Chitinophagaceae bacterium]